jgi:hypothetical protein
VRSGNQGGWTYAGSAAEAPTTKEYETYENGKTPAYAQTHR